MSQLSTIVVGDKEVVDDVHGSREHANAIISVADSCAVAIYIEDSSLLDGLPNTNDIDKDLLPSFIQCDGYHAAVRNNKRVLFMGAIIDLDEDSDGKIVKTVEWARVLFSNLRWS